MAYSAPEKNALNFALTSGYTAPGKSAINFELADTSGNYYVYNAELFTTDDLAVGAVVWFSILESIETNAVINAFPCINLLCSALETTYALSGTTQRRVGLGALDTTTALSVYGINEAPEGTEAVGPWPFEIIDSFSLDSVDILLDIDNFETTYELEVGYISYDGSAVFYVDEFSTNDVLDSAIEIDVAITGFNSNDELYVFAVMYMPDGDIYLRMPAVETNNDIDAEIYRILEPPDFDVAAEIDIDDIYHGRNLDIASFEENLSLEATAVIALLLVPLQSFDNIDAALQVQAVVADLETVCTLDVVEIYDGYFVECTAFSTTGRISTGINHDLLLPDISTNDTIECNVICLLITEPFEVDTVIIIDDVIVFTIDLADIYYFFVLTGEADGTTDIEIPISSFQCRRSNGTPSFLQVTIPGVAYADYITSRSNGDLEVYVGYKLNGEIVRRELISSAVLETVRLDQGTNSQTITLSGYKTQTYENKAINLTGCTYKSTSNGKSRYRFAVPNSALTPGDTITIDGDTFIADNITYYYRAIKNGIIQQMEIAEA